MEPPPDPSDMTAREIAQLAALSRQGIERGYVEYLTDEAKKLFAHPLDISASISPLGGKRSAASDTSTASVLDFASSIAGAQGWYVWSMRAIDLWEAKMLAGSKRHEAA